MHTTNLDAWNRQVTTLDQLRSRGMHLEFYDPDGSRYGLPTYPWRMAPSGLLTMRQLRASGLRPGGQEPAAQILWKHHSRRRVAYLYHQRLALPKRQATPAQLIAVAKALRARRTCATCGTEKDYCIPVSRGECNDCAARWER
jgi:hypothetical protein